MDVGVGVWVDVGLAVIVAVEEEMATSAASAGRLLNGDQAKMLPMRMTRRPKTIKKPGFFLKTWFLIRRQRDTVTVDVGQGGGFGGAGEITRWRAQRRAA